MNNATSRNPAQEPVEYEWLRDGAMARTRGDLVAEAAALVIMLVALAIGLVIAMLPATAQAAPGAPAAAASAPSLELAAFKIVPARAGEPEHRVSAEQARSGDQLEYVATYRNPTASPLHHVQVTVPVPASGVEYVLETAAPRADAASSDGKRYAPLPLQRTETLADGRQVTRPAPGADYRFLRWDLGDVPPGAVRVVRTRVQLLASTAAN